MAKLKKSAHVLETDELIGLVEETDTPKGEAVTPFKNDVLTFISTFNIEPGELNIKQHTLYTIYKAWSVDPAKKEDFLKEMRNFLKSTHIGQTSAFGINQNAIKLTHAAYKYYSNESIRINSKFWATHFSNFLKFHALTEGKYWIRGEIIYFIYDKYCHATGLDKNPKTFMGKDTFAVYCKLFLPHKVTKHGICYGISDNIKSFFQIGQLERMEKEYKAEIKEHSKRYNAQEIKAKQKRTSRFKSFPKSKK